ncbi:S8 family peptidase [Rhodococcus sp. IEGM1300]
MGEEALKYRQAFPDTMGNGSVIAQSELTDKSKAVWENSRHLEVIRVPEVWKTTKGEGVVTAVLDSGVCTWHPDLVGGLSASYDVSGTTPEDVSGHGSHCVGLIVAQENTDGVTGVAPGSKVISIKVMNNGNNGSVDMLRDGLRLAIDLEVDIINLSLGTRTHPGAEVELLLDEAAEKGIVVVAASGNENGPVLFPARFDNVIAVSGIDDGNRKASFSNFGIENLICAPAVQLASTFKDGKYARMSGTSMAAPVISGIIALGIATLKGKGIQKREIRELVLGHLHYAVTDLGDPGRDAYYGWGVLKADSFCRILSNQFVKK